VRALSKVGAKPIALAALVWATLSVGGCGWFGDKNKLTPLPDIRSSVLSTEWSAGTGNPKGFWFTPAMGDKVIYAAGHSGTINVIAEQGGKSVAQIETRARLTGGVGVADETIVVGNVDGDVLAYDAAGRSLWKTPLGGEILAAPHVTKTIVIIRTADGRMYALNRGDGKRKWVFNRAAPPLTLRSNASVAISRGVIYAGYPGGKVVAIELETGRPVWEATISLPRGTTELERIADVAGVPVVDESRVCAAVYQGRTGCVESLSGNVLWTRDISSDDGVAVDTKSLYVSDVDGNISALDKSSGSTLWKQEKLVRRDPGTPLLAKGRILTGDRLGFIHAMSPENGELVGRVATDGSRIMSLVLAADDSDIVIAQTEKGNLYAIAVR
jgi:outer membrane protein assembly factor BamB